MEDLSKMAIADIRPGVPMQVPGSNVYGESYDKTHVIHDYSHLLPPGYEDYRLTAAFEHNPKESGYTHDAGAPSNVKVRLVKRVDHPLARGHGTVVSDGMAHGIVESRLDNNVLKIGYSNLNPIHQGQGVGTAMYEATMHFSKTRGATHVAGDVHSSLAHAAHKRISDKHGMKYKAKPNVGRNKDYPNVEEWNAKKPEGFDNKYGKYKYTIKDEMGMEKSLNDEHLKRIEKTVQRHLTDDLRKPQYRGKENCLAGHCYVASEAMYHMLGGSEAGWVPQNVQHEGGPHWYLKHKVSGKIVDPTAGQFDTPVPYHQGVGKGFLTRQPSKRAQTLLDRVAQGGKALNKSFSEGAERRVSSVAVMNSEGYLLMGKRNDTGKWNCPGGKADPGESPQETARRELFEEAGIEAKKLKFLGSGWGGRNGDIHISVFHTVVDALPTSENDPDAECDEWKWIDVRAGLPEEIKGELNNPKDITLQLLGLTPASEGLAKGLKSQFMGAIAAAGLATTAMGAEMSHHETPHHETWTAAGLHEELHPIAHLESSFGKRVNHAPHSKGEYHSAHGAVGLKVSTAHEEYKRTPWLQKTFPNLHDPQDFTNEFKSNHALYNHTATAHWLRLKKKFGDVVQAAYAWRWGPGAALRDAPEVVAGDPYVNAYQKLYNTQQGNRLSALQNPLGKAEVETWLQKASTVKRFWTTRSRDVKIPADNSPDRVTYDQRFIQQLDGAFGAGRGASLKPIKLKLENIATGQNLPVDKERLRLYTRMARAGERLDPLVVRPHGESGKYFVVDGNHRWAAAKEAGLTELDAYEVGEAKPKAKKAAGGVPKGKKLYDLGEDSEGLMEPKYRQTDYGQIYEPVEMEDVEKELKRKGYHGYHGHTSDPSHFVEFPKTKTSKLPAVEQHSKGRKGQS